MESFIPFSVKIFCLWVRERIALEQVVVAAALVAIRTEAGSDLVVVFGAELVALLSAPVKGSTAAGSGEAELV